MKRNAGVVGRGVGRSLCAQGAGLLHEVDLGAGHRGGGDEGAVLGTDEREVALGNIGAVFGGFQLALESSYSRYALLGDTLLLAKNIVDRLIYDRFYKTSNRILDSTNIFSEEITRVTYMTTRM